ncbi:MAG: RNA polymerase sigma factor [Actinomycetota bacterium]
MDSEESVEAPSRLRKASRGRVSDLAEWFASQYEPLRRFGFVLTGDWAAADDLVQEAFVRLYRSHRKLEQTGLPAYARKTMLHVSRSSFAKLVREGMSLAKWHREQPASTQSSRISDHFWTAIMELPKGQRAVVALRYYEDLTDEDIARTLGLSLGTVKKQASRALARLRETLGRQDQP